MTSWPGGKDNNLQPEPEPGQLPLRATLRSDLQRGKYRPKPSETTRPRRRILLEPRWQDRVQNASRRDIARLRKDPRRAVA